MSCAPATPTPSTFAPRHVNRPLRCPLAPLWARHDAALRPGDTAPILRVAVRGDAFNVTGPAVTACGYTWVAVDGAGWMAAPYLMLCGGPRWNIVGVGLVSEGDQARGSRGGLLRV